MKFEFPTIEIKHFELEDILTASAAEPTVCWDDFSNCPTNNDTVCVRDN